MAEVPKTHWGLLIPKVHPKGTPKESPKETPKAPPSKNRRTKAPATKQQQQ